LARTQIPSELSRQQIRRICRVSTLIDAQRMTPPWTATRCRDTLRGMKQPRDFNSPKDGPAPEQRVRLLYARFAESLGWPPYALPTPEQKARYARSAEASPSFPTLEQKGLMLRWAGIAAPATGTPTPATQEKPPAGLPDTVEARSKKRVTQRSQPARGPLIEALSRIRPRGLYRSDTAPSLKTDLANIGVGCSLPTLKRAITDFRLISAQQAHHSALDDVDPS
jgi:hypothetical protein